MFGSLRRDSGEMKSKQGIPRILERCRTLSILISLLHLGNSWGHLQLKHREKDKTILLETKIITPGVYGKNDTLDIIL